MEKRKNNPTKIGGKSFDNKVYLGRTSDGVFIVRPPVKKAGDKLSLEEARKAVKSVKNKGEGVSSSHKAA